VRRYSAILQVGGDHSLEPAAALACTRTQYFVLAVSLLITTRVELVAHAVAAEVGDGIGAFLERLELVEREKWTICGVKSALFFYLLRIVKTKAAFAEWPVLPHAHALNQKLDGEEFVVGARGVGYPANKVSRPAHARSVAVLGEKVEGRK
jgi:hypothetical protein